MELKKAGYQSLKREGLHLVNTGELTINGATSINPLKGKVFRFNDEMMHYIKDGINPLKGKVFKTQDSKVLSNLRINPLKGKVFD